MPSTASMLNQTAITGPNIFPIEAVPNCCRKKKTVMMPRTMYTIVSVAMLWRDGMFLRPSTAEVMEMGGVMMPSASTEAPPIMAGTTSHLRRLRTSA